EKPAHEAVLRDAHLERRGARVLDDVLAVLLGEGEDAEDLADSGLAVAVMDRLTERADVVAGDSGPGEELGCALRRLRRPVLVLDAMMASRLAQVLAQELAGLRVEDANAPAVPLDVHRPAD